MKIAVLANDSQWQELLAANGKPEWIRCVDETAFFNCTAEIYINMLEDAFTKDYKTIPQTILINSVSTTLKEINASTNMFRINGWNGFLKRQHWELAGNVSKQIEAFFFLLDKTFTIVPDEAGMIAGRIIAMIINEAYFALEEGLSSKEEIDIAMKLGTNYPYGPFEWADKIGINNIYALLQKLSIHDKRYVPASLLQKQATL
jgi:3-hydroxybutyryl-CoA dehydrogenase